MHRVCQHRVGQHGHTSKSKAQGKEEYTHSPSGTARVSPSSPSSATRERIGITRMHSATFSKVLLKITSDKTCRTSPWWKCWGSVISWTYFPIQSLLNPSVGGSPPASEAVYSLGSALIVRGSPGCSGGKDPTCNAGDQFQPLGWEDPLGKGMATHPSILVWRVPWTEEPGGLQSRGSQRVRHHWVTVTLLSLAVRPFFP